MNENTIDIKIRISTTEMENDDRIYVWYSDRDKSCYWLSENEAGIITGNAGIMDEFVVAGVSDDELAYWEAMELAAEGALERFEEEADVYTVTGFNQEDFEPYFECGTGVLCNILESCLPTTL